jgi:hypothetical protein
MVLPERSDHGLGPERLRMETRRANIGAGHDTLRAAGRGRPPGPPVGATGRRVDLLYPAAGLADPVRSGLAMARANRRAQRRAALGIKAPQAEELRGPLVP